MPRIRVGDIEMYYEVHGEGTPLVHIGGLAGDARTWEKQIKHLAQHFKVLAFDNRGTGRSDCPDVPYSTKLFARDTVGLMDAVGIQKAHVLGISMGGAVAQEIALGWPDRVLSLVINCSFARMDRYGARTLENIMGVYQAQGPREAARHFVLYFYTLPFFNQHKDVVDEKENNLADAKRPAHAFIHSTRACLEHDARDRLPSIKVPVLVNAGSEDLMCSPGCSEEIARLVPGAKLKIYPGSSHFFLSEHFDDAMADIIGFLKAVK
ncbi:MAG TPA: alpha/beta hydrolase [Burkholderiales bacterium]|nr:alpha/beta hydrolase [Burkholderiales bacterium]